MLLSPDWKDVFAPNGRLLNKGEVIRRTNLSRTLTEIAYNGSSAFYHGPVANAIVKKVQSLGGILTHSDLEGYKVRVAPALEGSYFGRKVYTTSAPTSGPAILQMLNVMEHFKNLREEGRTPVNVHRLVEAMKCEFLKRFLKVRTDIDLPQSDGFAAR